VVPDHPSPVRDARGPAGVHRPVRPAAGRRTVDKEHVHGRRDLAERPVSGTQFDSGLGLVAGVLVLLVVFAGLRRSPKIAVLAWLVVICFVPVWIGQSVVAYFPAFTIISLLTAASLLPTVVGIRWSYVDLFFVAIGAIAVVEYLLRLTTLSATFDLATAWAGAFLLGRIVTSVLDARWIYGAVGVFFSVVAALAVLEFATGTNLFTTYVTANNANYEVWGGLQPRGGILRAEGAFGHSIALGSSLGVAVALTMGSRFRPVLKTAMVALMLVGAVVSFSRTGMITAAASVVLACLFLRDSLSRAYRVSLLVLTLAAAGVVFALVEDVFVASGNEAEGSALYRSELLQLLTYIQPFGLADNFAVSTTSEVSIGTFGSVDNALLLFGLIFGWVPGVLVLLLLAAAGLYVLRGRATAATIAVVAQIPALVTVALITQYAAVLWFAVGLAVSTQVLANAEHRARRAAARRPPVRRHRRVPEPVAAG
jgi:hypothetical protein